MTEADTKLCTALSFSKIRGPEISGILHSLYHDAAWLPADIGITRLAEARRHATELLVAILAAEQAMQRETA